LLLAPGQPDEVEQLGDAPSLVARRDGVQLREVAEVVEGRQPLVEPAVAAEDVADPLPHLDRLAHHVGAQHPRRARGGKEQRDQHLDRRGLAGAVWPQEPEKLALADLEADAADRLHLERATAERARRGTVRTAELGRLDHGHARSLRTAYLATLRLAR